MRTRRTRTRNGAFAALAALTLVAAACGGDDDDAGRRHRRRAATPMAPIDDTEPMTTEPMATTGAVRAGLLAPCPTDGEGSFAGMADDPAATAASNNPELSTLVAAVERGRARRHAQRRRARSRSSPRSTRRSRRSRPPTSTPCSPTPTLLTSILTYHVVPEQLSSSRPRRGRHRRRRSTAPSSTIAARRRRPERSTAAQATVVCHDVPTANATVYLIDSVLMPPMDDATTDDDDGAGRRGRGAGAVRPGVRAVPTDGEGSFAGMADDPAATAASNNPELSTLVAAVSAAGLVDTLNGEGPFTIFAPANSAFAKIPPADLEAVLADPTGALTDILTTTSWPVSSCQRRPRRGRHGRRLNGELTIAADGDAVTVDAGGGPATVVCADVPDGQRARCTSSTPCCCRRPDHRGQSGRCGGRPRTGEGPAGPSPRARRATVTRPEASVRRPGSEPLQRDHADPLDRAAVPCGWASAGRGRVRHARSAAPVWHIGDVVDPDLDDAASPRSPPAIRRRSPSLYDRLAPTRLRRRPAGPARSVAGRGGHPGGLRRDLAAGGPLRRRARQRPDVGGHDRPSPGRRPGAQRAGAPRPPAAQRRRRSSTARPTPEDDGDRHRGPARGRRTAMAALSGAAARGARAGVLRRADPRADRRPPRGRPRHREDADPRRADPAADGDGGPSDDRRRAARAAGARRRRRAHRRRASGAGRRARASRPDLRAELDELRDAAATDGRRRRRAATAGAARQRPRHHRRHPAAGAPSRRRRRAGRRPARPGRADRAGRRRWIAVGAAAAAVVALVAGVLVVVAVRRRRRGRQVAAVVDADDAQTIEMPGELPGAHDRPLAAEDAAVLLADEVPVPEGDRVYELWAIRDGTPERFATFRPDDDGQLERLRRRASTRRAPRCGRSPRSRPAAATGSRRSAHPQRHAA